MRTKKGKVRAAEMAGLPLTFTSFVVPDASALQASVDPGA